jgi:hypothetical protein
MTDSDGENRGGFGRLGSAQRFLTALRCCLFKQTPLLRKWPIRKYRLKLTSALLTGAAQGEYYAVARRRLFSLLRTVRGIVRPDYDQNGVEELGNSGAQCVKFLNFLTL